MVLPGAKYRGLTQPSGRERTKHGLEMRHTGWVEVQLSWGMLNETHYTELSARIGEELKIWNRGQRVAVFALNDTVLVQVHLLRRLI